MKRYIIIAGETSGDSYGSQLINSIKKQEGKQVQFWGIGGPKMIAAGLNILEEVDAVSVVGFSEVIKKLPSLSRLLNRLSLFICDLNPENIILIDFPGFNLGLAKRIKKQTNSKLHITYFISPQIWAWHKSRIKNIKKYIDMMLVIFPFEEKYYLNENINVHYVGHPFLDELVTNSYHRIKEKLGFNENKKLIGIFPGSRAEEIKRHLPIYLKAIHEFKNNNSDVECALGIAPGFDRIEIEKQYDIRGIHIVDKNPLLMLSCCDVAIVTSGTISLESTFMNIPTIVSYKLSYVSWMISKMLIKTKFISITNIIQNRMVLPELIQHQVTSKNIVAHLKGCLYTNHEKIKEDLKQVKNIFLNKKNAIDSAASLIIKNNAKN